jgi:hypothetical protein
MTKKEYCARISNHGNTHNLSETIFREQRHGISKKKHFLDCSQGRKKHNVTNALIFACQMFHSKKFIEKPWEATTFSFPAKQIHPNNLPSFFCFQNHGKGMRKNTGSERVVKS